MTRTAMGLPGDVERVVARYLELADEAVPGLVEGLYLVGSVALDDFRPGVSDVDFIAVSPAPPDEESARALAAVHARLRAEPGLPAFEGIYATFAELRRSPAESGGGLRMHGRKLSPGPRGRSPVEWTTLARHGVTVRGPAAGDLNVHTDRGELTAWTLDNLDRYWSRWVARGRGLANWTALAALTDWGVAWGVLGVSRLHYTTVTGQITSKTGAGQHALRAFGDGWRPVVTEALRCRPRPLAVPDPRRRPWRRRGEALAFMDMAIEECRRAGRSRSGDWPERGA
ncbi:MAG: nucleotidyltransferase domain-containing protein [Nocardiopsaceae bacterium]|nr:nucleotidyltransferase domain-containing protein [Nocardiopsaceae bacterium]